MMPVEAARRYPYFRGMCEAFEGPRPLGVVAAQAGAGGSARPATDSTRTRTSRRRNEAKTEDHSLVAATGERRCTAEGPGRASPWGMSPFVRAGATSSAAARGLDEQALAGEHVGPGVRGSPRGVRSWVRWRGRRCRGGAVRWGVEDAGGDGGRLDAARVLPVRTRPG
jgi:hypothetical protein